MEKLPSDKRDYVKRGKVSRAICLRLPTSPPDISFPAPRTLHISYLLNVSLNFFDESNS